VGSTTAGTATGSSTSTAVVSSVANAAGAGGSGGSGVAGGAGAAQSASATDGHQFASATAAAGGGVSKWSPNGNVSTQMTRASASPLRVLNGVLGTSRMQIHQGMTTNHFVYITNFTYLKYCIIKVC